MDTYKSHIEMLGYKAQDKVTGLSGMIDHVGFDAYGCVQASLKPTDLDKDGKVKESYWFDVTRLEVDFDGGRIVDMPDFSQGYVAEGKKGAAEKHSNLG